MISTNRVKALSEEPDAGSLLVRDCGGSSLVSELLPASYYPELVTLRY